MIKSMTGYGKQCAELPGRKITVEVKSLNSKQFDLNLRIPGYLRDKEWELRAMLSEKFGRGKVDFSIVSESTGELLNYSINQNLAKQYHLELQQLSRELNDNSQASLLPLILKMPDVVQSGREELGEQEWATVSAAIQEAIKLADLFRINEGKVLEKDMLLRVDLILQLLDAVEPYELQRMSTLREKMLRDFSKFAGDLNGGGAPDLNRFEQEMIYYLEKLDITEEKVRLKKHCDYFTETVSAKDAQGKKLGFITQEMGREINTLGAKASDAEIQKIVVQMKDELEKIKEQLGNVL